ncbi:MAG: hypothetical protein IT236_09130 [Bacteroidia bacterium]|nr:hypothetical protein [Bacteroidia bacterium]
MIRLFLIILISLPTLVFSQEKLNPRVTLRTYVGIPKIVGSQMFRTSFNGVVETGGSVNVRVANNFFVGLGYQYNNFVVNKKEWSAAITTTSGSVYYATKLQCHSGFLKLGYDRYFSEIGYITYGLNLGYMQGTYQKVIPDSSDKNKPFLSPIYTTPYLQPEISFNFQAEKKASFSLILSYTALFYKFDPKGPRFNHIGEITEARNRSIMSWINIGLGCNLLFKNKK